MDDTGIADLRSALRQALDAARADGVPPSIRITLLVSELGYEIANAEAEERLDELVASTQAAVEHAARTARDERSYQDAVERFVERWLN